MSVRPALLIALLTATATPALAQSGSRGSLADGGFSGFVPGGMRPAAFARPLASTVQEGLLNGQANLVTALGQANKDHAEAELIREHARKIRMENNFRVFEYNDRRRDLRANRRRASLAEKASRLASRRANRDAETFLVTYDASTWPPVLASNRYASLRAETVGLLTLRSELGGNTSSAVESALAETLNRFAQEVSAEAEQYGLPRGEFESARRYLRDLPRRFHPHANLLDNPGESRTMLAMADE